MLLFTDLHLNNFREFSTVLEDGLNSRLVDQLRVVRQIWDIIDATNTKNVFFLGDLIDGSDGLPKVVCGAAWAMVRVLSHKAHLFILAGNHDLFGGMPVLSAVKDMSNVTIITRPTMLEIEDHRVDLIPWGGDFPKKKGDVLLGHLPVRGAVLNNFGVLADFGHFPDELSGYRHVFLGHFHEFQEIPVEGADYAGYIGSVIQVHRGSYPSRRGVVLFSHGRVNFVGLRSPRIYSETIRSQEDIDRLVEIIARGHYWHLTVTDPGIILPSFDHRVLVEYDLPRTEPVKVEETIWQKLDAMEDGRVNGNRYQSGGG
jgi:DNA repair exonuclease SbcCD nuclease subunit